MKSCCTIPTKDDKPMCPSCKNTGKSVPEITLAQLVKREFQKHLKKELPYFFCKSEDCDVVYFSKEGEFIFKKGHVRVRVGIKEKEDPMTLCYCFDYTKKDIEKEIKETGKSTAAEDISQKIKEGLCACEVRNPQGSCCLGDVNRTIKKALSSS